MAVFRGFYGGRGNHSFCVFSCFRCGTAMKKRMCKKERQMETKAYFTSMLATIIAGPALSVSTGGGAVNGRE